MMALLASAAQAADKDEYANIHTVAVVSTLGDGFIVKRLGIMVFGNSEEVLPTPGWDVDGLLEKLIGNALSSRFTVKSPTIDHQKMRNCPDLRKCIAAMLPPDPSIDAYIFVRESDLYARGAGLDPHGIGLFRSEVPFSKDANEVHALYLVSAVDAHTGDNIDYGTAKLPETVLFGDHPYPVKQLTPPLLPDSDSKLDANQLEQLHPIVIDLIQRSYTHALINAHLLPESAEAPAGPPPAGTAAP
jgi:hypothetical protein